MSDYRRKTLLLVSFKNSTHTVDNDFSNNKVMGLIPKECMKKIYALKSNASPLNKSICQNYGAVLEC